MCGLFYFFTFSPSGSLICGFRAVVINSHFPLFNFIPYLSPSFSISSMSLFIVFVSLEMHVVSSAYVTSSESAPGILCLVSCGSNFVCTSWNKAVITLKNRYGESGHPCRIPVDCASQSDAFPSISKQNLVSLQRVLVMFMSLLSISHSFHYMKSHLSIDFIECFLPV